MAVEWGYIPVWFVVPCAALSLPNSPLTMNCECDFSLETDTDVTDHYKAHWGQQVALLSRQWAKLMVQSLFDAGGYEFRVWSMEFILTGQL